MANKILIDPIIVKATFIAQTRYAWHLDCEGDKIWFPKSQVEFNSNEEILKMEPWLYKEKFPEDPENK